MKITYKTFEGVTKVFLENLLVGMIRFQPGYGYWYKPITAGSIFDREYHPTLQAVKDALESP